MACNPVVTGARALAVMVLQETSRAAQLLVSGWVVELETGGVRKQSRLPSCLCRWMRWLVALLGEVSTGHRKAGAWKVSLNAFVSPDGASGVEQACGAHGVVMDLQESSPQTFPCPALGTISWGKGEKVSSPVGSFMPA